MADNKSYAEFILGVLQAQLKDCSCYYPELAFEFNRDFKRLSSAIKDHGIRFALDTMVLYRKHLDKCLDTGRLTRSGLIHFGSGWNGSVVPRLFRGLTLRVFDDKGSIRPDADATAVRLLRQLLGVVRKLRLQSSPLDRGNAVREFFRIDSIVEMGDLNWSSHLAFNPTLAPQLSFTDHWGSTEGRRQKSLFSSDYVPHHSTLRALETIQQVADLFSSSLGVFDPMAWRPKHGPGAVADLSKEEYKYSFRTWSDRLDSSFPYADFALANYACGGLESVVESRARDILLDPPARLHAVPKTLRTPRLIAAEPVANQWCQQVIKDYFYNRVRETVLSKFIDFRRQELNGGLALAASRDASLVTVDLSAASDHISCRHVERLFRRSPALLSSMMASRSLWIKQDICTKSPEYALLRKYSTMGNATTFPVQSILFAALAVGSLLYKRNLPVTYENVRKIGSCQVRVFGDDIIVPKDCSGLLLDVIKYLRLKVNPHKTFGGTHFRESCGVDAFQGHDVTTVSILESPRRSSPGSIVSSVDVHHNLLDAGYVATARYIQKTACRAGWNSIRYVTHRSGLFGWSDMCGGSNASLKTRWSPTLHIREIRCLKVSVVESRELPKDHAGLLQFFTEAAKVVSSPFSTIGHLTRRPQSKVRLGWVSL